MLRSLAMELGVNPEDFQDALRVVSTRDIEAELQSVDAQLARLKKRRDGLDLMLKGRLLLDEAAELPVAPEPRTGGEVVQLVSPRPTGTPDAILRVMRTKPDQGWTLGDVYDELVLRNWHPVSAGDPRRTVGATLSRMARTDKLLRKGQSYWITMAGELDL